MVDNSGRRGNGVMASVGISFMGAPFGKVLTARVIAGQKTYLRLELGKAGADFIMAV